MILLERQLKFNNKGNKWLLFSKLNSHDSIELPSNHEENALYLSNDKHKKNTIVSSKH